MKRLDARLRRWRITRAPAWRCLLNTCKTLTQYLATLLLLGAISASYAADEAMKADYLVKFAKYVNWPKASGDIHICVIGPDPFGTVLDQKAAGETVKKRNLVTKRLSAGADTSVCEILFISAKLSSSQISTVLGRSGHGTLTVSDVPGFVDKGGIIEFFHNDGKLRFEINNNAAHKAGLKLSSNLLKLAAKR
jgi:hypothetical protein